MKELKDFAKKPDFFILFPTKNIYRDQTDDVIDNDIHYIYIEISNFYETMSSSFIRGFIFIMSKKYFLKVLSKMLSSMSTWLELHCVNSI